MANDANQIDIALKQIQQHHFDVAADSDGSRCFVVWVVTIEHRIFRVFELTEKTQHLFRWFCTEGLNLGLQCKD